MLVNHNQTLTSVALVLVAGCTAATRQPAVEVQGQSEPSVEFAYVSVLRDGQSVGDVAADEFIVEEDGERRQVIRVGPALIPMQVAILVDDSQVLRTAMAHIRMGLNELIDRLPNGQQIALRTFGDQMQTVVDYTDDRVRLKEAATEFVVFSATSGFMLNALVNTALDLQGRGARRPVIVLLTSEGSNAAMRTVGPGGGRRPRDMTSPVGLSPVSNQGVGFERVLSVLRETRVAVHTLVFRGIGTATFRASPIDAGRFGALSSAFGESDRLTVLEQLPSVTGGSRVEVGRATSALPELLRRMVSEITNQYLVMYARPPVSALPREVAVSVTRPGLTVRSTPALPLPGAG